MRSDFIMWKFSKDGEFFAKLAYQVARQEETPGNSFQASWIWKLDILPKIIHFLWLGFHDSILVHGVLASRGINCDKLYPLCNVVRNLSCISYVIAFYPMTFGGS